MIVEMNESSILSVIAEGLGGNYLLSEGEMSASGRFYISYVGRSDDLRRRLLEHLNDKERYVRAWVEYEADEGARYRQECVDYHTYSSVKKLRNVIHPAKPTGYPGRCPVCGR